MQLCARAGVIVIIQAANTGPCRYVRPDSSIAVAMISTRPTPHASLNRPIWVLAFSYCADRARCDPEELDPLAKGPAASAAPSVEKVEQQRVDDVGLLLLGKMTAFRNGMGHQVVGHFCPDRRHVEQLPDRCEIGTP